MGHLENLHRFLSNICYKRLYLLRKNSNRPWIDSDKTRSLYKEILLKLKPIISAANEVIVDFQKAAIATYKEVFEDICLYCCFFHFP